jgi:hypothetical protein
LVVARGAWRLLRTADGERPVDVAGRRGHGHLLERLEPVPLRHVPGQVLSAIQARFHQVIRDRMRAIEDPVALMLPELEPLLELSPLAATWFAIPGMYGGFSYRLVGEGEEAKLIASSWCRVVEGSGERHEITADRTVLVEVGFV